MTHPNGKHQTNCAGEWRDNDLLIDRWKPENVVKFCYDKSSEQYLILRDGTLLSYWKNLESLKSHFINISELARAAGREL